MRNWLGLVGFGLTLLTLTTTVAEAHTGGGITPGWEVGFNHPFSGVDHIVAMIAVGLIAAQHRGQSLWMIPGTFLLMMTVGGTLAISGMSMPLMELGIAISVIVLGALVALNSRLPVNTLLGLIGVTAIFHGYAHGAEMPDDSTGVTFTMGFMSATALLHVLGIGIGRRVVRIAVKQGRSGLLSG